MTVLVLDSPELIARAAALEAAQTSTQVQAEDAGVTQGEAQASPGLPLPALQEETSQQRREENLALVV